MADNQRRYNLLEVLGEVQYSPSHPGDNILSTAALMSDDELGNHVLAEAKRLSPEDRRRVLCIAAYLFQHRAKLATGLLQ
jgi:hypothetical protein